MIRVMLDTDNPAQLTGTSIRADILATYADLMTPSLTPGHLLAAGWPRVVLINRTHDPLNDASVLDVERGLHSPADAPAWWDRQHAAGVRNLAIYANRSTMPAVDAAMGPGRPYYRWFATLDGTAHLPGYTPGLGPAAIQILGEAALGFHADLSLVLEDSWNRAPAVPPPVAAPWVASALTLGTAAASSLAGVIDALEAHK